MPVTCSSRTAETMVPSDIAKMKIVIIKWQSNTAEVTSRKGRKARFRLKGLAAR